MGRGGADDSAPLGLVVIGGSGHGPHRRRWRRGWPLRRRQWRGGDGSSGCDGAGEAGGEGAEREEAERPAARAYEEEGAVRGLLLLSLQRRRARRPRGRPRSRHTLPLRRPRWTPPLRPLREAEGRQGQEGRGRVPGHAHGRTPRVGGGGTAEVGTAGGAAPGGTLALWRRGRHPPPGADHRVLLSVLACPLSPVPILPPPCGVVGAVHRDVAAGAQHVDRRLFCRLFHCADYFVILVLVVGMPIISIPDGAVVLGEAQREARRAPAGKLPTKETATSSSTSHWPRRRRQPHRPAPLRLPLAATVRRGGGRGARRSSRHGLHKRREVREREKERDDVDT
ncbi:uncharacterized protein [Oryza sativa Japonica Group]|uniref:uncharacterized protein n=1 Tax=Oryza sativa subsp. japonica TaxID=39947 RepID=UPI0007754D3B|nr:uncharacterized protein LOC107278778 [Oryza sativa Japonica Group]